MKTLILSLFALTLSSAAVASTFTCEGANIEAAGVSRARMGTLTGEVSWDCFPGGGICNAEAKLLTESKTGAGDTVFSGKSFKLVVYTSKASESGEYKAHISATDLVDGSDEGRGMTINESVSCKEAE